MKSLSKLFLGLGGLAAVCGGVAFGTAHSIGERVDPVIADAVNGNKRFTILFDQSSFWTADNAIIKVTYSAAGAVTITKDTDFAVAGNYDDNGTIKSRSNFNVVTIEANTFYALSMVVDITTFTYSNFYFDRINPTDGTTSWNNSGWILSPSNVKNGTDNTYLCNASSNFSAYGLYYKVTLHTGVALGTANSALAYGGSTYSPADPAAVDGYDFKGWFTDSGLTTAYSPTTLTGDYNLYAKYEMNTTGFSNDVLSKTATECASGAVAPSTWNTLSTEFTALSSSYQNAFKIADAIDTGTTIQQAAARYDFISKKYKYTNFALRSTAYQGSASVAISSSSDKGATAVFAGLALVSVAAAGGYFFIRKKHVA
jgi:uncharacterized repeat protein (TIGR02543 family)